MITDKEIQKIFEWANKNKVVGKTWKRAKWGINPPKDEWNSIKRGIPRDKDTLLKITHLNLSKSRISDIPIELFKLKNLKYLDISGNSLTSLPNGISQLDNLEYLDLSNNYYWDENDEEYLTFHILKRYGT